MWSIIDGAREHGVSWHRMEERADAGAILEQRPFPIAADERAVSLNVRCYEAGAEAFAELLHDLESGAVTERVEPLDRATRLDLYGVDRSRRLVVTDGRRDAPTGLTVVPAGRSARVRGRVCGRVHVRYRVRYREYYRECCR